MNIYLVRHGESISNINKQIHKTTADHQIPLSPNGVCHAKMAGILIAQHLEQGAIPYFHVRLWTSPYQRTRQTADEVEKKLHGWVKDRREHVLLCEQQFGLFDGLTDEELTTRYPDERHEPRPKGRGL